MTKFPAPGEFLFLASYAGIAGFLILDVAKRVSTAAATWLETIVICGGAVCLAGSLLVTPAAGHFGHEDLRLLLALLYPLIDIILLPGRRRPGRPARARAPDRQRRA